MEKPLLLDEGPGSLGLETGLSTVEARHRLQKFGRNEVPIEDEPLWKARIPLSSSVTFSAQIFLRQFTGTMPAMLILACILSAAVQDWEDLFIIFAMLFLNACIAFYEETKAMASLDALKGELKQRVSVLRDGVPVILEAAELVPGDVVSLRGGQAVPADVLWLSGDSIKLDTAALTGEPIPWTIPRRLATREAESSAQSEDDRQDEQKKDEAKAAEPAKISVSPEMAASALPNATGRRMLSGCVVVQGECQCYVTTTGVRTEIGQAAQMVAASKSGPRPRGLFESKIIAIVTMLITATLAITVVVFIYLLARSGTDLSHALLVSLSLVIGAVPIALPLVLQVTMALGAREMAEHGAIVTHTTALQEIASMTVLNSDKTGTLTTAKMSIIPDMIWLADDDDITRAVTTLVDNKRFTADDCLLLAALASNPTNLDDPIDAAVFQAVRARFAEPGAADAKHPRHAAGAKARLATYGQREKFDGFNPNVKRAVARYRLKNNAKLRVAKGLLNKILDTGGDGAAEQWICAGVDREMYAAEDAIASKIAEEASQDACFSATIGRDEPPLRAEAAACAARQLGGGVRARALAADAALSAVGYKTIAVCAAFFDEESGAVDNMRLVGLIPMLDPPRHDTASTIHALRRAGVAVKMITGDHVNIARETARLIGLGDNILPQCSLWPASATRDETIWQADGFAQVMPVDKREVVLVLQNRGLVLASVRTIYARVCASRSRVRVLQVVGMTGDGVNDAAALAQAQVGIAVEGATDAATNAADIVLTRQGLSAIYAAVYESRLIFRRLRSYVLYRVAATIQIVLVLCALIFGWGDELKPFYVVLLALLNDVTMTPIAHDHAEPSPAPELPETASLLLGSAVLGVLQALASIAFYILGETVTGIDGWRSDENAAERQVAVYVQVSISVELLIFVCRAPKPVILTKPPSFSLFAAVVSGTLVVTVLAAMGLVVAKRLTLRCLTGIWLFDLAAFVLLDIVKVALLAAAGALELRTDTLASPSTIVRHVAKHDDDATSERLSVVPRRSSLGGLGTSPLLDGRFSERASVFSYKSTVPRTSHESERPSLRTSLRPNTPANIASILAHNRRA